MSEPTYMTQEQVDTLVEISIGMGADNPNEGIECLTRAGLIAPTDNPDEFELTETGAAAVEVWQRM